MSKPSSNPLLFIGKPLKDEYGRQIGEIASFLVSPNGRIDGVLVKHGDGEFLRYSSDHFKLYNDSIILLLPIKRIESVKSRCPGNSGGDRYTNRKLQHTNQRP